MRRKTSPDGLPLRANLSLLSISIALAVTSSLYDTGNLPIICLATGGLLTLVAVGPSSFSLLRERARKGKITPVEDLDAVIPGWKRFCHSMGIEKDIQVNIFANLRNAYAEGNTINIGQPVLATLDSISVRGVFAHELAHIKGNHAMKGLRLLAAVVFVSGTLLEGVLYGFGPSGSTPLACVALLIILTGLTGIAMRFISWPFEYTADLTADERVKQGAVASALKALATLRRLDVRRDSYGHPSINKRIANLGGRPQNKRFVRWYLEL
jgi:Zn-dependent protease with chaperone function